MLSTNLDTVDKTRIKPTRPKAKRIASIELEGGINFTITEASLPLQIGRESDCDITIPLGHVSRHHCELFTANGALYLKDTSSNGTLVGRQTIRGDSILINKKTAVEIAGDALLVITPLEGPEPIFEIDKEVERREKDRRGEDRRKEDIIVPFEQRKVERRKGDRRNPQP